MAQLERRMSIVETALADFIKQSNRSLSRLEGEMLVFKNEMKDFKDEMKDFKDEMRVFKDEMKDFKDEMRVFKDGMEDFKDEMKDFKDEMRVFKDGMEDFKDEMKDFKDETREDRRHMNKQWGELANRMGTLIEDIVAPAFRPAIEKYFKEDIGERLMIRREKYDKKTGLRGEFDLMAITETSIYLVQTKSSPDKEKLLEFKNKQIPRFRKLFPEYDDLRLVPIMASLRFEDKMIRFATKEGVYVLAYREWDFMDILNFEEMAGS